MATENENILIVPDLEPRVKHATIFERFEELNKGETLIIINDHDPKPLYYQMQSQYGDVFDWEYLESGPETWRIKITMKGTKLEVLDATKLPPSIKHQTIFEKYDSLGPGEAFVLSNDHDPKPLYYQLQAMHGDTFTWQYIQQGPYEFRILIAKDPEEESAPAPSEAKDETQTVASRDTASADEDINIIDVPSIEPRYKHPTIFRKFDELKPGETLTIHNDHDPKPLYYQLKAERGYIFNWEYLEEGPMWRIRITKKLSEKGAETIGDIVSKDVATAEVFNKYGIDFCCNGGKSLQQACLERGVDIAAVEKDLLKASEEGAGRSLPYNEWNLDFLADYIVNTHHSYQKKTIPNLRAYSEKVMRVHGAHHPELAEINELVQETMDEIEEHNIEEENVLFPYIKKLVSENGRASSDKFSTVEQPIDLRVQEHQKVGDNMDKIRELSQDFALPDDACASYGYLYRTLDEFEKDLHIHIHLENNILFPKAIKLEKGELV